MIIFEKVGMRYPSDEVALQDISFHIKSDEMVFLTGHSGAGKSTLLKLIMMMERPTSGNIAIDNVHLNKLPNKDIPYHRRKIGTVFQEHHLLFDRTVFDNVALPLIASGIHVTDLKRRVHEALDKVNLLHKADMNPITLSGGQQQRVGIARSVVNNPKVILADEPTGNLDPSLSIEIMSLFEDLSKQNTTVLLATHDLALIARMNHRLLNLRDGRLVNNLA